MFEITIALFAIVGALSLLFAAMAFLSDFALPFLSRKPWQPGRKPAATYRRSKE